MTEAAGRLQGEIYTDLYRFKQQGFRDAIASSTVAAHPTYDSNPALWTYLAAAHGQAYLWERDFSNKEANPAKAALLDKHRAAALTAVRKALALGDAWKPILQVMWDKNHPAKRPAPMGQLGKKNETRWRK